MSPLHSSLFILTPHLLLVLLLFLQLHTTPPAAAASGGSLLEARRVGGYKPIKNLRDPHVIRVAEFAVSEHNREAHTNLELVEVVRGETQVTRGRNFRLVIRAREGDETRTVGEYQAVVHERAWEKHMSLVSFTKLI